MEYATVLLKTADVLFKFLGSPVCKEIQSIWKYEEDIEILARIVGLVKVVLSDVEGKNIQDESVITSYKSLREAFLDAEDFLDKVTTHKKKLEADDRKLKGVRRVFSRGNQPIKYAIMGHNEIKKNRKSLNAVAEDLQKFGLGSSGITEPTTKRPREACSFVDSSAIIGRDDDKGKVIDLLLGSPADQDGIPIVSVVGIGGMGKTTLAGLVFNDKTRIESGRFDLNLWVSNAEKFDMKSLLKEILLCISPYDTSLHSIGQEQLQNRLIREIGGKKYLLVLDDLQNESRKKWVEFESLLNRGDKESRILVTTRSRKVAKVTGSASTYELKGLSDGDAWQLFEKMAFDGNVDESLVEIGKLIVKKCSEVPLAIKTIGCLLYGKNKHTWERVRDIEFAKIKDEGNDLMPILKIRYDDLDPTLKQCFRYCALLPKNIAISKEIVCNIWMANGCIDTSTPESIEDTCDDYLEILYNRCFLEKEKGWYGTHFKMHPLMHDLAKEVSGAEMLVLDSGIMLDSTNKLILKQHVRHMNVSCTAETVDRISTFDPKNTRLRTLLRHDVYTSRNPWEKLIGVEKLISQYKVLRMLDLREWGIKSLPNSIGNLIHLRFLDLSKNNFETLPDSIAELWNLQSLLLMYCTNLKGLPDDIVKLVNLRHLNLEGCRDLTHMPSGMSALTSLRTLCKFIVGPPKSKRVARLVDLEPLSQLQGDLTIKLHDKSTRKGSGGSGSGALLVGKRLRELEIKWPDSRSSDEFENDVDILAKLQPHPDLKYFGLYGYAGLTFPPWMMGVDMCSVLRNLVCVKIDNCTRCLSLPSFSKLLRLRRLTICNMLSLEYIEEDFTPSEPFFPSLVYLEVEELPELKGWCRQLGTDECPELEPSLQLPAFPCLSQLRIDGCPRLRMTCMPLSSIHYLSIEVEGMECISLMVNERFLGHNCVFKTTDNRLKLSIPWDQHFKGYLSGMTVTVEISGDISTMDTLSSNGADAFRRMSKGLVRLTLCDVPRMTTLLDGMEHLSALRELRIESCCKCTFNGVDEEESEQRLENGECSSGREKWEWFGCLESLTLKDLPKLVRLPEQFQLTPSLKTLEIQHCCSLKMAFFRKGRMPWKGLESLSFSRLHRVRRLPDWIQFATSLKSLTVEDCRRGLTNQKGDLWGKGLTSLETLRLSYLLNMVRLPEWILSVTSLKSLEIQFCNSLEIISSPRKGELSWEGLDNLESLTLSYLPQMTTLPEGIQLLTSLKSLKIERCSALEVTAQQGDQMPVKGGFTSLTHLTLYNLPRMARLPDGIHQFATPLQRISINDCGTLQLPEWVHNSFNETTEGNDYWFYQKKIMQ